YVVLLAVVALEVPLALNLRDRVEAELRSQAEGQADTLATAAEGLLAPRDAAALERVVDGAARTVGGRAIVVDARGRVVADSAGVATRGGDYSTRPEIAIALRGRPVQQRRY